MNVGKYYKLRKLFKFDHQQIRLNCFLSSSSRVCLSSLLSSIDCFFFFINLNLILVESECRGAMLVSAPACRSEGPQVDLAFKRNFFQTDWHLGFTQSLKMSTWGSHKLKK